MERLTQSEYVQTASSISPDGRTLAFVENSPSTGYDVMLLNIDNRKVAPLLNSRFSEQCPEFSPDGRWLAYVSDELAGRSEVYVQPFPGPGGKWQISNEGGSEPLWAGDGKRIFYRRSGLHDSPQRRRSEVWAVDVQGGSGFTPGKPVLLFEETGTYSSGVPIRAWDIHPDGLHFLMVKLEERKPQTITEIIFVHNWFEELKRLVPIGNK